jgi:hypothetical protein
MFNLLAVIAFIFALVLALVGTAIGVMTWQVFAIIGLLCMSLSTVPWGTYVKRP